MAVSSDRIVRNLRRSGVVVDVAHLRRDTTRWAREDGEGGRLLTCPVGDDPEHALRRAATLVDPATTHVVAFGGALPILAAPIYAAWNHALLITLLRGNDFDTGVFSLRRRGPLLDALERSDHVCVVARSQVDQVRSLVDPPGRAATRFDVPVPVSWITNGIDAGSWVPLPSDVAAAERWRLRHVPGGRTTIGLIGQLKAKKGVSLLLDALAGSRARDRVHLVLVGDLDDDVAERLARIGPATHTRLGFRDRFELLSLYPALDYVALPSFYDGLPNVALEAAALGLPLVASDAGGLADLVREGVTGITFAAGDIAGCRAALDRAVRLDPAARETLGKEARRVVELEFTEARETAAYRRVLGLRDPSPLPGGGRLDARDR
jgi:glycosyltransferase involved in cell wall biosynthesis